MTALTLYELSEQYRTDLAKLADLELDDQTVADTLEGMQGELAVKATNVAKFIEHLSSSADAMKEAEKRMKARREAVERRVERIRHYLLACMQHADLQRIESPEFCLSIKKNPPSVDVFDERQIPATYMTQPEPPPAKPNKTAIAADLKKGVDVPGCRLLQSVRLSID